MNSPRFPSISLRLAALLLLAAPAMAQDKSSMTAKLDELLRHPGDYSQICDAIESSIPAPLPGFRSIMHGEAGFSKANREFIKKNRAKLIPVLAAKLTSVDLKRKPQPQPPDKSIPENELDANPVGVDPACFNTLLLTIIEDLDAAEVLPELLAVEEKFHAMLVAGEKDPGAPLPETDGDGAGVSPGNLLKDGEEYGSLSKEREAEVERAGDVFQAQAVHRDMLAVCVRIMRKAGYDPMLASDLEKTYGRLLKEKWGADEELSKYKSAADIPADEREDIKFDPVHKVAYMTWQPVDIPYSESIRTQIIDLTKSFVASLKK